LPGVLIALWPEQVVLVLIGFYLLDFLYSIFYKKEKFNLFQLLNIILWAAASKVLFFCAISED